MFQPDKLNIKTTYHREKILFEVKKLKHLNNFIDNQEDTTKDNENDKKIDAISDTGDSKNFVEIWHDFGDNSKFIRKLRERIFYFAVTVIFFVFPIFFFLSFFLYSIKSKKKVLLN